MPDQSPRVIVITGASSGFGRGVALALAEKGNWLVLAARRLDLLEQLAEVCVRKGGQAVAVACDVGRREDVEALARIALETYGRIDVWINNAGVGVLGQFEQIPLQDLIRVLETNLHGTVYGCHYALQEFKHRGQGVLINVASALGKIPAPYYGTYTASKYAIVGLSAQLRQELAQQGHDLIRVCTVMPMAHDTPFFDHTANYSGHEPRPVPPLYDPRNVVDTLVDLVDNPEDEVVVGGVGKAAVLAHNVLPGTVEVFMGKQTHAVQMEEAAPAGPTAGALHAPMKKGDSVSAGRLEEGG